MGIQKRQVGGTGSAPAAPVDPRSVLKAFPSVLEHLTATVYSNGEPRQPGWLTIGTRDGEYRVTAGDRDANASLSVQDASLNDALAALDLLLADPATQWQIDQWRGRGGTRAKKKGA